MRFVNRAAGGAAIILLLSLLVVSCNGIVFGRLAQADPACRYGSANVVLESGRIVPFVRFTSCEGGGGHCDRL